MGCAESSDTGELVKRELTLEETEKAKSSTVHHLVMFGTGHCGKSTLYKQVKSLKLGDRPSDRGDVAPLQESIISQMKYLIDGFQKAVDSDEIDRDLERAIRKIVHEDASYSTLNDDVSEAITLLWSDPRMQEVFQKRNNLSIADCCPYFFDNLERYSDPAYHMTEEEYLRFYRKTTGVTGFNYTSDGAKFKLFDTGGQRSERSKSDTALFTASLTCYDQMLHEDETVNAMDESMDLFSTLLRNRWFRKKDVILIFTRSDLFREKVTNKENRDSQLDRWYPDWDDRPLFDFEAGLNFLKTKFLDLNDRPGERVIENFVVSVVDRNEVEKMFLKIEDLVIKSNTLKVTSLL